MNGQTFIVIGSAKITGRGGIFPQLPIVVPGTKTTLLVLPPPPPRFKGGKIDFFFSMPMTFSVIII